MSKASWAGRPVLRHQGVFNGDLTFLSELASGIVRRKKARVSGLRYFWLGCRDSNPGMLVSETSALPLGDTPIRCCDLHCKSSFLWLGCRDSNPGMLVSETSALPLGDTPIKLVATTGIEPVTPAL